MNISHRMVGQLCILQMRGNIVVDNIDTLESCVSPHIQDKTLSGIIMNFKDIGILDSSGIGYIISCYHTLSRAGVPLVLCNLNRYHQIFSMTGLDKILSIFESEEEALNSFTIKP